LKEEAVLISSIKLANIRRSYEENKTAPFFRSRGVYSYQLAYSSTSYRSTLKAYTATFLRITVYIMKLGVTTQQRCL